MREERFIGVALDMRTVYAFFVQHHTFYVKHKKCNWGCSLIIREQCRAARALLDWSRERLAESSNVALRTVVDFERGAREPRLVTKEAICRSLEAAGVEFIPDNGGGAGVRLRKKSSVHPSPLPPALADVLASFSTDRLPRAAEQAGVGELRFVIAGNQATLMEGNKTIGMISVRAHEVVFSPELPTGRSGEGAHITEDDLWNWVITAWQQAR